MYKLATCCLLGDTHLGKFGYKKMTKSEFLKNRDEEKLLSLWNYNINKTHEALKFLSSQEECFHFFRISSDLFPLATLQETKSFYKKHISSLQKSIAEIGKEIKSIAPSFRLVTHPGQFTILNSKNPKVVNAALEDLQYHYDFMSSFSLPFSINIHIGSGSTENDSSHILRFEKGFSLLPQEIKNTLSLENDEKVGDLSCIIEASKRTGVKICYDHHHQACYFSSPKRLGVFKPYSLSEEEIDFIGESWKGSGMVPTMHLSNRRELESIGGKSFPHSDFLYDESFNVSVLPLLQRGWDLEVEAKAKFPAVKKFKDFCDSQIKIN